MSFTGTHPSDSGDASGPGGAPACAAQEHGRVDDPHAQQGPPKKPRGLGQVVRPAQFGTHGTPVQSMAILGKK